MKLLFGNKKEDLLSRLKKHDPAAQKIFYDQNVKKYLGTARGYISDLYQAEDCVIKAFCKIFKHIESYRGEGNFDAWARKIVVNECLNFIKSHKTVFIWMMFTLLFWRKFMRRRLCSILMHRNFWISFRIPTEWFLISMYWKNIHIRRLLRH